jgi:hypothetical protein
MIGEGDDTVGTGKAFRFLDEATQDAFSKISTS